MAPLAKSPIRLDAKDLVARAAGADVFAPKLKLLSDHGVGMPVFEHVAAPAHAFIAAMAARRFLSDNPTQNAWVVCPDTKTQERVHAELSTWLGDALFFPEHEASGFLESIPDPDIAAERLAALHQISEGEGQTVVCVERSLWEGVPSPAELKRKEIEIKLGDSKAMEALASQLEGAGYERTPQVAERGQFAIRGGIFDLFSWQEATPVRIEFFGDEIESIRTFDVDQQTTLRRNNRATIMLGRPPSRTEKKGAHLQDYLREGDLPIAVEIHPDVAADLWAAQIGAGALPGAGEEDFSGACYDSPVGTFEAGDFIVQDARRQEFKKQVSAWLSDGWEVSIFFHSEGEIDRFREVLGDGALAGGMRIAIGGLARGFAIPDARIAALSGAEIFGRYQHSRARRIFNRDRERRAGRAEADLREISESDLVVHQEYGIGKYRGLETMDRGGGEGEEVLVLEYAEETKLYVPLDQAHLVSRYVGTGKKAPQLSALGGNRWTKTRAAAEKSILDYAAQLLSVQAARQTSKSYHHPPDNEWQLEFENSFLYKETKDQLSAIEDSKLDMESGKPMDRLICGDVGFGKTEVAIRTAFKAVMGGRQVAVLVPTTVLAQQHYETFRERMSDYPVTIDLLSRYRTPRQQRETVRKVAAGTVDIVIGTHRLISKDIAFKNLGLVVVDEEQRFGVKHKERFKELFQTIDVLTLSATPIPRTLYLSLMGARDMSTIETPPPNRYPVETSICPYDERVIRDTIKRELDRQGQVFFLHNRVMTIDAMKRKIEKLVPGARVIVGHGQMEEGALEDVMKTYIAGEADILVSTTIIESGIDIPNANTIIIDRADRFGLADLYQLRGRVGRAQHKAYAILLLPREMIGEGDARKRINAIKQYTSLGSGFRIAMRDLEIRGAGNLLGTQQSGHIAAVGFDLYCKLLKQSIARLRGEKVGKRTEVALRIDFICTSEAEYLQSAEGRAPAFIPSTYMEESRMRILGYKMLAEVGTGKELKALIREWRDRFGRFPEAVDNLLRCTELRLTGGNANISSIEIRDRKLMLERNGSYIMVGKRFPRLEKDTHHDQLREAVGMVRSL